MTLTDSEKEALLERATARLFEINAAPVIFELELVLVVGLIGQLQLAFRHPENTGATRVQLEKLVRDLIERLDPAKGDVYQFLMMGFDPDYDE